MSLEDRERWDSRYAAGSYAERAHPCPLLGEWGERLAAEHGNGPALDLACGRGRNALHLARLGFEVDAIDISPVGIEHARAASQQQQLEVNWTVADLEDHALPHAHYRLIVVSRYRVPQFSALTDALVPGGTLLYEQHTALPEPPALPVGGPRSTRFRLAPNELIRALVPPLWLRHYEEGVFPDPDGAAMALARMVANKPL